MAKQKFYVVRVGHKPGIYTSWAECEAQTKGFKGAKFKAFGSESEAKDAFENGWDGEGAPVKPDVKVKSTEQPVQGKELPYDVNSLCVDAACSGNPGPMEYRGVDTKTDEEVFRSPVYPSGTNNIGEFLGIVDGLRYLKSQKSDRTLYSDSVSALAWVRDKKAKTHLVRNEQTEELWLAIEDAQDWLRQNTYKNPILKWETKMWGEVKADFGRK